MSDYDWADAHPVAEAYRHYLPMPYERPTWDLTAVLEAVRPHQYFKRSQPGWVTICHEGTARFTRSPDGQHCHLLLDDPKEHDVLREMVELCAHRPQQRKTCRGGAAGACCSACRARRTAMAATTNH